MRERQQPTVRRVAAGFGVVVASVVAGGFSPLVASAETCSATNQGASCDDRVPVSPFSGEPGADPLNPFDPGAADGVQAGAGHSVAETATGGFDSPDVVFVASPTGGPTTAAGASETANGGNATVEAANIDRPVSRSSAEVGPSRADSLAVGDGTGAAATASRSSNARALALGPDAVAASAAREESRAAALSVLGGTSGAAANDHSRVTALGLGPASAARATADDHDHAVALAGPGSRADVASSTDTSPARADCSGFLAAGLDLRGGVACAGPISDVHLPTTVPAPHGPAGEEHDRQHHRHHHYNHHDDCP